MLFSSLFQGIGGMPFGVDGIGGTGGTSGNLGANKPRSSATCPAGVHATIPCCQTKVCSVNCPVGTKVFKVA